MLIVMRRSATPADIEQVCRVIEEKGLRHQVMEGSGRTAIGVLDNESAVDPTPFTHLPGVKDTIAVSTPYKQVSREWRNEDTVVRLNKTASFGGNNIVVIGGPCAIESRDQLMRTAEYVAKSGGTVLRGGAFKPRTSPYSFQGLGEEGLQYLAEAGNEFDLATVTEAIDGDSAKLVAQYADMIQIGARNMQNFQLLKQVGALGKPVMVKRGMSATIEEWLLAAEYVVTAGSDQVILCERGVRHFDPHTRNLLDIAAIPVLKALTHLPVIADPSHGTGRSHLVPSATLAAVAAGADGVMIETHPQPDAALSDGPQSLTPEQFSGLMEALHDVANAIGRNLAHSSAA